MSVTSPLGFRASEVTAGCKPSGAPDLGLLVGDPGTTGRATVLGCDLSYGYLRINGESTT